MGKMISNSVERFYCSLIANEELRKMKIYDILEECCMKFYNVCARFADVSLNVPKYRMFGTCDIEGSNQFEDIEKAKWVAKDFYDCNSIEDVNELLRAIRLMYRLAVRDDDIRSLSVLIKQTDKTSYEHLGIYYNFEEISQDIWDDVEREIMEYTQNS